MHRDSSVLPARQPHRAHGAAAYTAIAERALHDQLVAVGLADRDTLRKRLDELGLADRLTISVPEAGRLLGLGETASYAAAHRGDIPHVRLGRKMRVFVAALLHMADGGGDVE